MAFYVWDKEIKEWTNYEYTETYHQMQDIKCVTFNVLFDERYGVSYRSNVIYSQERYADTLKKLHQMFPDVISLNEVTKTFLKIAEECEWVRENYFMSEVTKTSDDASSIHGFGNLVMTRIPPSSCEVFTVESLPRPIVTGIFNICGSDDKKFKLSVVSAHLTSMADNFNQREKQITSVSDMLQTFDTDVNIIQGDMNFHSEVESKYVSQINYIDAWEQLYDIKKDPGYTFDAELNHMSQEIWLGFENRKMRLDRVLMSQNNICKVKNINVIFDKSIYEGNNNYKKMGYGKALISLLFDIFGYNVYRDKNNYLFNSDHYGLVTTFEV